MTTLMQQICFSAGFLDGEGSFISRGDGDPSVIASQADLEPLKKLQQWFGGHVYPCKANKLSKKPLYSWQLNGSRAIGLMMTVFPLVSKRRQGQIHIAITRWRQRRLNLVLSDADALVLMRRVCDGETMLSVAKSVGFGWTTISHWMNGLKRPHLLAQLQREYPESAVFAKFEARHGWARVTDDDILHMMRECKRRHNAGESLQRICDSFHISRKTMRDWYAGLKRPHLLARLEQELLVSKEV